MKKEFKSGLLSLLQECNRHTLIDLYKLGDDLKMTDEAHDEIDMIADVSFGRATVYESSCGHVVWRRVYGNDIPTAIFIDKEKNICACLDYQGCVNWLACEMEHYGNYTAVISYDATLAIWNDDDVHGDIPAEAFQMLDQKQEAAVPPAMPGYACNQAFQMLYKKQEVAMEPAMPGYECNLFNEMRNHSCLEIAAYLHVNNPVNLPKDIAACIDSYDSFRHGDMTVNHLPDGSYKIISKEEYGPGYHCLLIAGNGTNFTELGDGFSDHGSGVIESYGNLFAFTAHGKTKAVWDKLHVQGSKVSTYKTPLFNTMDLAGISSYARFKEYAADNTIADGVLSNMLLLDSVINKNLFVLKRAEAANFVIGKNPSSGVPKYELDVTQIEDSEHCTYIEHYGDLSATHNGSIEKYGNLRSLVSVDGKVVALWRVEDVSYVYDTADTEPKAHQPWNEEVQVSEPTATIPESPHTEETMVPSDENDSGAYKTNLFKEMINKGITSFSKYAETLNRRSKLSTELQQELTLLDYAVDGVTVIRHYVPSDRYIIVKDASGDEDKCTIKVTQQNESRRCAYTVSYSDRSHTGEGILESYCGMHALLNESRCLAMWRDDDVETFGDESLDDDRSSYSTMLFCDMAARGQISYLAYKQTVKERDSISSDLQCDMNILDDVLHGVTSVCCYTPSGRYDVQRTKYDLRIKLVGDGVCHYVETADGAVNEGTGTIELYNGLTSVRADNRTLAIWFDDCVKSMPDTAWR